MYYNILVTHQRDRWKVTEVIMEAPSGLSNKQYEELARNWLRENDYDTYCFVTEYPLLRN